MGTESTLYRSVRPASASTSTLMSVALDVLANRSKIGVMALHGPHHEAVKYTIATGAEVSVVASDMGIFVAAGGEKMAASPNENQFFFSCAHARSERRVMEELPVNPCRLIRKSSYGRTDLFLKDPGVTVREIRCMGGIRRKETANVYHMLPDARHAEGACCWHCCEEIHDGATVVPLPSVYDSLEGVYHVYGRTCSPGCAKAYVLEHTTFDRGQHLNVLIRMLRDVYGIDGPIVETPPRPALRRFGGVFDPTSLPRARCRLIQPPFVSYCMLVEEHNEEVNQASTLPSSNMIVDDDDGIDEPQPPAAFDDFLRRRADARPPAAAAPPRAAVGTRRRGRGEPTGGAASASGDQGPMSKFCKT